MKRIPALICAVLALSLAACSEDTGMCPSPPCSADGGDSGDGDGSGGGDAVDTTSNSR
jgi:hypothetical protein